VTLLKAASTVSLLTLVSRFTGLAREQLIAATFGASAATDAFNVAFRIPNLFRRLFAEGAFSQAFVPMLAATRARDGDDATRELVNAVATVLAWVLLVTCVAGVAGAPVLVWAMGSGLERFDTAVILDSLEAFAEPAHEVEADVGRPPQRPGLARGPQGLERADRGARAGGGAPARLGVACGVGPSPPAGLAHQPRAARDHRAGQGPVAEQRG
jgi:hypothetical protein